MLKVRCCVRQLAAGGRVASAFKALKEGATKEEIAESIAVAMGVNAAAIVDLTDIAAASLDLEFFK